jgi:hypothetical protein
MPAKNAKQPKGRIFDVDLTDGMNELIRQLTPDDRAWRDALRPVITKYMSEQQFVPKTVLELEAEDLNKTVCTFEEQLRKNGRSATEIAKAIRDRLGGRVTAADIKSGNVWWR